VNLDFLDFLGKMEFVDNQAKEVLQERMAHLEILDILV
jgi:hypothetical protein